MQRNFDNNPLLKFIIGDVRDKNILGPAMKNVIIGTAGHIDHGKTTLIKALTGRDTDRLKEEKERGISIDLGFTYFDLPSGRRAGIIDVPGHEKFIKNMLAGIGGIDVVVLVIAADEGVMPQTKEHLNILKLLPVIMSRMLISEKPKLNPTFRTRLTTVKVTAVNLFVNPANVTGVRLKC